MIDMRVETAASEFTGAYRKGQVIKVAVAHHDGAYTADADTVKRLEDQDRVAFRYAARPGTGGARDQSQRLGRQYRRHLQREEDRARPDAPSRERHRSAVRGHRRAGAVHRGLAKALQ